MEPKRNVEDCVDVAISRNERAGINTSEHRVVIKLY
jgi:hypothetical protein